MSTQVTDPKNTGFSDPTHVIDPDEAGSPNPDNEVDEEGDEGHGEGEEPEYVDGGDDSVESEPKQKKTPVTGEEPNTGSQDDSDELVQLRRQNAEQDEILREISREMDRDPELAKRLGSNRGSQGEDYYARAEKRLRDPESGLSAASAEIVLDAFGPLLKDYTATKRELSELRNQTGGVIRTLGTQEFQRTLADRGVSTEIQKSKPFQKLMRTLEHDPDYKSINRDSGRARFAASEWQNSNARRNGWKDQGTKIESVRNAGKGTHTPGTRSPSTADRIIEIVREHGGGHVEKADRLRVEAQKARKPMPRIQYVDKK